MRNRTTTIVLLLLSCLMLSSCGMTKPFVDTQLLANADLPAHEKLLAGGGVHVEVPYPEMYFDAALYLERFMELVEGAQDYMIITTFLGSSCPGLEPLYDAIAAKAESGVDVYMIIDAVSSYDMTASADHMFPLYFLRDAGVHMIEYNPLSAMSILQPGTLLVREHRKIVVVDGRWCTLGGMNMNYISLGADDIDLQRDSMYVFDSPALADALVDEFVTIWNESSVEKVFRDDFATGKSLSHGSIDAYLFNQGPGSDVSMADMYAALFSSAKEEIVMLPYLAFFDDNMYRCLEAALERGVEVKIYLPIDSREYVQGALFYDYHNLVEAGFDVNIEYAGEETGLSLLHQKLCVVDGRYTVIGSSNINYRSMGLSHEIALVLDDEGFARSSLEQVASIAKEMHTLDLESALALKEEKGSLMSFLFSYFGG